MRSSVPGRRWWWSMRRLVLAGWARWAARPRGRGGAVGAGVAGWPRPPGRPGSRWRARRRTAAVSKAAVAWRGAEGVGLAWGVVLVRLVGPAHRVSSKDAHLPGAYDVAPHSRSKGMFTANWADLSAKTAATGDSTGPCPFLAMLVASGLAFGCRASTARSDSKAAARWRWSASGSSANWARAARWAVSSWLARRPPAG